MAEIASSTNEKVAAMAIAYDVALKAIASDGRSLKGDELVKTFLEQYKRVYQAVADQIKDSHA